MKAGGDGGVDRDGGDASHRVPETSVSSRAGLEAGYLTLLLAILWAHKPARCSPAVFSRAFRRSSPHHHEVFATHSRLHTPLAFFLEVDVQVVRALLRAQLRAGANGTSTESDYCPGLCHRLVAPLKRNLVAHPTVPPRGESPDAGPWQIRSSDSSSPRPQRPGRRTPSARQGSCIASPCRRSSAHPAWASPPRPGTRRLGEGCTKRGRGAEATRHEQEGKQFGRVTGCHGPYERGERAT